MAITISEKDVLFIAVNVVGFIAVAVYISVDVVAGFAQMIAATDINYSNFEIAFSLLRNMGKGLLSIIGVILVLCDLWWAYRFWKQGTKAYWRENL